MAHFNLNLAALGTASLSECEVLRSPVPRTPPALSLMGPEASGFPAYSYL
jgi:hypothetical protein